MILLRKYLLLIISLIGIVMILVAYVLDLRDKSNTITWPVIILSIGSSIIATIIFAWIYELRIAETTTKSNEEKYVELSPLESFPASDSPLKKYNDLYDDAFYKTSIIKYKGDKVLYLAFRLYDNIKKRSPWIRLELILPNPQNDSFFYYRAQNLVGSKRYKGKSAGEIELELKTELFASLMALYDIRDSYNFEIYFCDEVPFLRYEILDSILVMSALAMQRQGYYPPTLVYSKESLFYSTFLTNFNQVKDLASKGIIINNKNISESLLISLANDNHIQETAEELREKYRTYFSKI